MLSTFILALAVNLVIMYTLDVLLNKRFHKKHTIHFVIAAPVLFTAYTLMQVFPAWDWQYVTQKGWNPILTFITALLMFDGFVFFMHKYVEHGIFWKWHKAHHAIVSDHDLTYYSPAPVGPEENFYYVGMQMFIPFILGMGDLQLFLFVTWVFQHGGYVHQKGLPELPWPFISCKHHRNHHFAPKTYYSGFFLFWDKAAEIDPRAIHGFTPKRKQAAN